MIGKKGKVRIRLFFVIESNEFFIVRPRHSDINIIVPRNIAMMTHSSQQSSHTQEIAKMVRRTEGIKFHQHIQHDLTHFFDCYLAHGYPPSVFDLVI